MALDREGIKRRVREDLIAVQGEFASLSPPERRLRVRDQVVRILRAERAILPAREVTDVVNEVSDEVVGLGPVERLLKDPEVSEVMVNGADDVYVERKGRIERVEGLVFEGLVDSTRRNDAPTSGRVEEGGRVPRRNDA